jgi:hypothetical protein
MSRLHVGRRGALLTLALAALVAGVVLVVVALVSQTSAPEPPRSVGDVDPSSRPSTSVSSSATASAGSSVGAGVQTPAPAGSTTEGPPPLKASRPVRITIPAIKVSSVVNPIGLTKQGELAVPQPGPHLNQAAWFEHSPTPGQPGPSIIEGHVDSESGPSVFYDLGNVRPGNKIHIVRADGVETVFTVNAVRDFKKSEFPTTLVYGAKDLSKPQLRVITCSDFDRSIGHHVGNEVVFAHLTAVHRHHH